MNDDVNIRLARRLSGTVSGCTCTAVTCHHIGQSTIIFQTRNPALLWSAHLLRLCNDTMSAGASLSWLSMIRKKHRFTETHKDDETRLTLPLIKVQKDASVKPTPPKINRCPASLSVSCDLRCPDIPPSYLEVSHREMPVPHVPALVIR